MSRVRVYIAPFVAGNTYADYIEVSNDVKGDAFGRLRQQVDNSDFDVGLFKFNDASMVLNNQHGKYGNAGDGVSIFNVKRSLSLVRVDWEIQDYPSECGIAVCGEAKLTDPVTMFKGILNDDASKSDISKQHVDFKVLGREGILDSIESPYADFNIGDTFKDIMLSCLGVPEVNDVFNVDAANINPPINLALDAVEQWENTTIKEVFDDLLLFSNSVLYIDGDDIYITNRDASADVKKTFYSQASRGGLDEIIDIKNYKLSLNNTFNYWTWDNLVSKDTPSIDIYGVKKKDIDFEGITQQAKRVAILDALRDEFAGPKQELDLTVPMTYQNLELFIGDQVRVDYPTVYRVEEGRVFPFYDLSKYDEAYYPSGEYSITIDINDPYKIMGRTIDTKKQMITFNLRGV